MGADVSARVCVCVYLKPLNRYRDKIRNAFALIEICFYLERITSVIRENLNYNMKNLRHTFTYRKLLVLVVRNKATNLL